MENLIVKFRDEVSKEAQENFGNIFLQMKAWEHISSSVDTKFVLPEQYQLQNIHSEDEWLAAINFLTTDFVEKDAFLLGYPLKNIAFEKAKLLIEHLLDSRKKGLLQKPNLQAHYHRDLIGVNKLSGIKELIYAFIGKTENLYIPFDEYAELVELCLDMDTTIYAESQIPSPMFALMRLFGHKVEHSFSDAITNPNYVREGKLVQFEKSVAIPSFTQRVEKEFYINDRLDRFEFSRSYTGLAIQHLLRQTKTLSVVFVPANFIYKQNDKELHQSLVKNKQLKAVISLPSYFLYTTKVQPVMLVLDSTKSSEEVLFIDGERFTSADEQRLRHLTNVDEIVDIIHHPRDTHISRLVSLAELMDSDCDLNIKTYVRTDEEKAVFSILNKNEKACLDELVDFIRPLPINRVKDAGSDTYYEVMANDVPEYGIIESGRELKIDRLEKGEERYLLQNHDIVLIIRGSAGRVGYLDNIAADKQYVTGQTALAMRMKKYAPMSAAALYMQLHSKFGQTLLNNMVKTVTIPNLSLNDLKNLQVVVPTKAQQKELEKNFYQILENQKEIAKRSEEQYALSQVNFG